MKGTINIATDGGTSVCKFIVRFMLSLAFAGWACAAEAKLMVDTSNAIINSDSITNIFVDGIKIQVDVGNGVVGDVYDSSLFSEIPDLDGLPTAVSFALIALFNARGTLPSTFNGCETINCVIFIPEAYNATREFYALYNPFWSGASWIPDGGDLTSHYDSSNTSVTLGKLVSVSVIPTPATFALFGIGLAGLRWPRRKKV